jgi:hypothetical protein
MSNELILTRYIRTPFQVKAVVITEDNIAKIAELIGVDKEVKRKGDDLYIALDKRVVPNVNRAYIGWYVTILGDNYRCYSPKVFDQQFMQMPNTHMVSFGFPDGDEEAPVLVDRHDMQFGQLPEDGNAKNPFNPPVDEDKEHNEVEGVIHHDVGPVEPAVETEHEPAPVDPPAAAFGSGHLPDPGFRV